MERKIEIKGVAQKVSEETSEGSECILLAYIVTDDDRRFQSVDQRLPDRVEPVRLYESYLTNFRFAMGR